MTTAVSGNPYFGKRGLLSLTNWIEKTVDAYSIEIPSGLVEAAYGECRNDNEKKLFCSIVVSAGDVRREHLILGKPTETLGVGKRFMFHELLKTCYRIDPKLTIKVLIPMSWEYSTFWHILAFEVRTKELGKRSTVDKVFNILSWMSIEDLGSVIFQFLTTNTDEFKFMSFYKYMNKLRSGKRTSRRNKGKESKYLPETLQVNKDQARLYSRITIQMGWQPTRQDAKGRWLKSTIDIKRAEYNQISEAVLFSTGKINTFSEESFYLWLRGLPSGARFNVKRYLYKNPEKWITAHGKPMKTIYDGFIGAKDKAAKVAVQLQAKVASGKATLEDRFKLEQELKKAKLSVGGNSLFDVFQKVLQENVSTKEADSMFFNLLNGMKDEVAGELILDVSGSMTSAIQTLNYSDISRSDAAKLMLALFLYMKKRDYPNEPTQFFMFSDRGAWYEEGSVQKTQNNPLIRAKDHTVESIIDLSQGFMANYKKFKSLSFSGGSTRINTIFDALIGWVNEAPNSVVKTMREEYISTIPAFRVITDGDFNNEHNAAVSLQHGMNKLEERFGWNGVFIVWDVSGSSTQSRFEGMSNVIYLSGFEPDKLNMFAASLGKIKRPDIYSNLMAYADAERYAPVRALYDTVFG